MNNMDDGLWICKLAYCGYVYNPGLGDWTQDIPPGIPFGELPNDWICPKCKLGKDYFNPYAVPES